MILSLLGCVSASSGSHGKPGKQQSLSEWRRLTEKSTAPPKVFVNHDQVRFYFWPETNVVVQFKAKVTRQRWPSDGYAVDSAPLVLEGKPSPIPRHAQAWREAQVISGGEWRQLATNLIGALTPPIPGHGAYYRGLLGGHFLYRDADGLPRFGAITEPHKGVTIDHHYSIEETLQILARLAEQRVAKTHPKDSLFVLMTPNSRHFPQPLLVDRARRQCLWLSPVDFYRSSEPEHAMTSSGRSLSALLLEGNGLAFIKNPVSSAGRLANLIVQTFVGLVRLPLPGPSPQLAPLNQGPGMDLNQWEHWLDRHTLTHEQRGSLTLLVDGERFFPRLQKAIAAATNHIHFESYIFDNDDVAVEIADQLKQRSSKVKVDVILDRLGSISAGQVPPATPPATNFASPTSIITYLKTNSHVSLRPFLNPFCSYDHSKVYLVDGQLAWLGGMNIGREYRYEWHDSMVELEGPVVESLEEGFRRHWAHESLLGDLAYLASLTRSKPTSRFVEGTNQWTQLRLLPTRTLWKPFSMAVLGSLSHARHQIFVENPYLFDKRVINSLVRARSRGVDVRAIIPKTSDSKTGRHADRVICNYLLKHGVRVFIYPGMTHVKALLVDGWTCLGSGNLNQFGLRLCQEQNVATSDPQFAATVQRDLFEPDFDRSYELTQEVSVEWLDSLADIVVESL